MPWLPRILRRKQDNTRFAYCVLGTGHGAEKMCEALRDSPTARVAAIMSSSLERAQKFARRYGIETTYTYDHFEDLKQNTTIEAVYLPLPVKLHRDFTDKAATAGKHVLCEKPIAASTADAAAMIAATAAANRLLMVAYRLDYDPMHAETVRLLAAGALGTITHVTANFGIVAKTGWRFDPAMAGGGSLFDVGVYPLHALQALFGNATIQSAAIKRDPTNGLELDARWAGTLPNGAQFRCRSSYLEKIPDTLRIEGSLGWLELKHAFAYDRTELRAKFRTPTGQTQRLNLKDKGPTLFRLEAEHLAACAKGQVTLRSPGESGLQDLETIARIERLA